MFKKTLLAAALAAATFGANAATVITTQVAGAEVISNQGLPATGAFTLVDDVILTLKATDTTGITDGGRLVVTVSGAFFTNPAGATAAVGGALAAETVAIDAAASTSTKLIFDLAENGDDWTVVDGDTITISGVQLQISGTEVKLSSVFQTATNIDVASTAAPAVTVAKVGDQWVAGVVLDLDTVPNASGALNALINVGDTRETFVDNAASDSTTTDTLSFDVNTVGAGADLNDVTVTIAGDFKNIASVVATTTNAAAPVTYVVNEAMTEAAFTYTADGTKTDMTEVTSNETSVLFTLVTGTEVASMDVSSFNMSIDVDYDDAEAVQGDFSPLTAAAAGGFELNGSSVTLEYVPFGPNTALILQATSTFDEDAFVSVSYLNPTTGLMVELENIATASANSVSRLGTAISNAIIADSGLDSGKTRMVVTINAPDADVSLFTGFKDTSDKDRLGLPQT